VPAAAPAVTSINPTSGSSNGGTEVTVYGTDFVEGDDVPVIIGGNHIYLGNITHCGNDTPQKECHRIGGSCFR
jgi:hypothetical protein